MFTEHSDRHPLTASNDCSDPTPKPELTLVSTGKLLQRLAYCLLLVSIVVGTGLLSSWSSSALASPSQQIVAQAQGWTSADNTLLAQADQADLESNFVTAAVDKVESAVVQVNVSRTLGGGGPEFLRPFLGGPQATRPGGPVLRGLGSGFVIDDAGRILTNAHVVDQADTVTVSFQDGRILEGKVLGKDPVTDVAVLQVQAENLPKVVLGDSDKVRQGQWAIAIGNPLGLQETVTVGVISGTERSSLAIGIPDKRIGFIQTDAAINPGNSGGPLLNAKGEVIGINTAIIQGSQGLGFTIPINAARQVAQQLITQGKVEHPYIGVQMIALNPQVKQQINNVPNSSMQVELDQGILVASVRQGSPAAKAGLRMGDVIERVNDQRVTEAKTVQQLLDQAGVGGKLQVELQRNRKTVALTIEPEQFPDVQTR